MNTNSKVNLAGLILSTAGVTIMLYHGQLLLAFVCFPVVISNLALFNFNHKRG